MAGKGEKAEGQSPLHLIPAAVGETVDGGLSAAWVHGGGFLSKQKA